MLIKYCSHGLITKGRGYSDTLLTARVLHNGHLGSAILDFWTFFHELLKTVQVNSQLNVPLKNGTFDVSLSVRINGIPEQFPSCPTLPYGQEFAVPAKKHKVFAYTCMYRRVSSNMPRPKQVCLRVRNLPY